jgi:hypothetical protein
MNFRDVELLSSYLDGRLKPQEATRLEARLSKEPELKATLEDLRQTRTVLRRLPQRRAPRSFRLTPKMAGVRPPEPRSYPVFRFATALAAFLFVAAVAVNAFTPFAARQLAAAPAPAYGMGGGGGGSDQVTEAAPLAQAPAATEEPTLQAFTTIMGTATPEGTTAAAEATESPAQSDTARTAMAAPTAEAASKSAPNSAAGTQPSANPLPIPLPLIVALGALMLILAVAAWILRRNNERHIRSEWNQK